MSIKLRILCVFSALCFLGSIACFSGFAAELMDSPSGEEFFNSEAPEPGASYVDPGTVYPDPGTSYVDPGYTDPGYTDPGYSTPGTVDSNPTVSYDPGYTDPVSDEPGYSEVTSYESTPTYSATVSDVISEGNYSQPDYGNYNTEGAVSVYTDYTSQYNQYIANTYQAKYDDNYFYVPSYTAPEESLIEISSKEVDTDELTEDDWEKIMLGLSDGNTSLDGTQTFNFIKDNEEKGDTSVAWMLYLGVVLIILSIFTVIFVIITTNKANDKMNFV